MIKRKSWQDYQKEIADDHYYYARSCIRQNFFPGSEKLFIDMRNNTVTDGSGDNRYGALAPAPRFWYVAPGSSNVSVILENTSPETILTANWWPRRWAVV